MIDMDILLRWAGVGEVYLNMSFDSFNPYTTAQKKALEQVKEYAEQFADGDLTDTQLFIHGPVGTGKTHLAAALVRHLLELGIKGVRYTDSFNFFRLLGWKSGKNEFNPIQMQSFLQAPILVIDLFPTNVSPWQLRLLAEVIGRRIADGRANAIVNIRGLNELAEKWKHAQENTEELPNAHLKWDGKTSGFGLNAELTATDIIRAFQHNCIDVELDGEDHRLS